MARAKRWTIPFKSLNGTDCRIDIYDENWTGSVTTLSATDPNSPGYASANPFYYEEDDDEDLLTVIRYRTGYINLIEKTYNGLIDLYPETDTEHYIEFYYGSTLDFTGYIQAQNFENEWTAPPREIQLPVQSPLGLCDGMYFAKAAPSIKYRDDYLTEITNGLNAAYTGSIFPDYAISFALRSIILCPLNENVNETDGSDLYEPKTYTDFLESFCYIYGLIVHDTPTKLVFSKFDENGSYSGTTAVGSTVRNITDFFIIANDQHRESAVHPLKDIRIDYDGSALQEDSMNLSQMPFIQQDSADMSVAAWFKMMTPRFTVNKPMSSYGITSDRPSSRGVTGAVAGGYGGQTEGILVYPDSSWHTNEQIFEVKFFNYPILKEGDTCILTLDMAKADFLFELPSADPLIVLDFSVDVEGEYYNPQTFQWDSTVHKLASYYGESGGKGYWLRNVPLGVSLNVKFYYWGTTALSTTQVAIVKTIQLSATSTMQWIYKYSSEYSRVIDGAKGSKSSGSFGLVFNKDRLNDHSTMWSYQSGYVAPTFSYMFFAQNRLKVTMKASNFPSDIYITKWAFWVTGWRWRVISVTFEPWDDNYTITMHRSSTIE